MVSCQCPMIVLLGVVHDIIHASSPTQLFYVSMLHSTGEMGAVEPGPANASNASSLRRMFSVPAPAT